MSTPKPQGSNKSNPFVERTSYAKCGRIKGSVLPVWMFTMDAEKMATNWKIFQSVRPKGETVPEIQLILETLMLPRRIVYICSPIKEWSRELSECYYRYVTSIFTIDVYALLDPGATLSFVTPLEAMKFNVLPKILKERFFMSTPTGYSVIAKRVCRDCPIESHWLIW